MADSSTELLFIDRQHAVLEVNAESLHHAPSLEELTLWANSAYRAVSNKQTQATIRLVDTAEMTQLNRDYRHKDKPTNVLSFPFEADLPLDGEFEVRQLDDQSSGLDELNILGDIIICHSVIIGEADDQSKSVRDHYAHMVVHGILHLCGYDHENDTDAQEMESLEVSILGAMNITNPYQ